MVTGLVEGETPRARNKDSLRVFPVLRTVTTRTQVSPLPVKVGISGVVFLVLTIQASTSLPPPGVIEAVEKRLPFAWLPLVTRGVAVTGFVEPAAVVKVRSPTSPDYPLHHDS